MSVALISHQLVTKFSAFTVKSEDVCCSIEETLNLKTYLFSNALFLMFITAVCVLFISCSKVAIEQELFGMPRY